jgi:signal transduction histidine kinase
MEHLVDSLLRFARSGAAAGAGGPGALPATIRHVVEDLGASIGERGAEVEIEVPDGAAVLATEEDVGSVLRNLVSNAVKFGDAAHPRVCIAAEREPGGWRLDIKDNGIGIDAADRPRIFGAFQRLHSASEYPGTGLGLAIAQRVVERHGGAIGVDSVAGEGSRFWFVLPAA